MSIKVGINGFGRMGRLAFRVASERLDIQVVQVNDPSGSAEIFSHLINFDSVHGRWNNTAYPFQENIKVAEQVIMFTQNNVIEQTDWSRCDIVIESSGKFKSNEELHKYIEQGVKKVILTAPSNADGILNIVMGVNHHLYDHNTHHIITAASCTTNCLAPVIKVIHENIGIQHGSMTTIHNLTNTQTIVDAAHQDLRRARSCGNSLIPTTTGSAKAITQIFPELKGKLNGHAVRVPLTNASLTDCVFELQTTTDISSVNRLFEKASENELKGILGYEKRPLVSIDYITDPRSAVIDALSTMVINGTQLKVYIWYDNEWGYVNRTLDLVELVSLKSVRH